MELRFSSRIGDRTQSMILRLAKLLKSRSLRYTLNREKIKLRLSKVEKVLNEYVRLNEEMESVSSVESDVVNRAKMATVK